MPTQVRVKSITWESPSVLSLILTPIDKGLLPTFGPGAHIDLRLPGGAVRRYSICSSHQDASRYRIGVREVSGGISSGFIHRKLRVGDIVEISDPRNKFPFDLSKRYLFIAGGIGITPLLPMIKEARNQGSEWKLLYCNRRLTEAPFLDEILALHGDVHLHTSELGTRLDVSELMKEVRSDTLVYCCGPNELMTAVEAAAAHWPINTVRFEWFTPRTRSGDESSDYFEVYCKRSDKAVHVRSDQTIIDALSAAGIEVAKSCEEGICGTCEVKVFEGDVDHRDSILSPLEKATNGTMMICVSRAKGQRLVLDI